MLNTKYIIVEDDEGNILPYTNEEANGNAWFIKELRLVNSANEEIKALDSLDNKNKAVYSLPRLTKLKNYANNFTVDSLATINVVEHKPNYFKYESNNVNEGFAVFSEVYYGNGWKTFIDGKETSYIRVNYTLRGMEVPAGKHIIEFRFDPDIVKPGISISFAISVFFGLLFLGVLFYEFKKKPNESS